MPEALPVLLKNAEDPKQLDAVRVAALVGVVRRVAAGLNEADEKKVTALTLNLLKTPGPEGLTGDGYAWLLAQAADILGRLHGAGARRRHRLCLGCRSRRCQGIFHHSLRRRAGPGKSELRIQRRQRGNIAGGLVPHGPGCRRRRSRKLFVLAAPLEMADALR